MSRRNELSFDDQGPVRSGFPSGVRGVGACRSGLPSAVRGTIGGGTLIQFCARTGADVTSAARTKAPAVFTGPSIAPLAERGRSYLPCIGVFRCGIAPRAALQGRRGPRYSTYLP